MQRVVEIASDEYTGGVCGVRAVAGMARLRPQLYARNRRSLVQEGRPDYCMGGYSDRPSRLVVDQDLPTGRYADDGLQCCIGDLDMQSGNSAAGRAIDRVNAEATGRRAGRRGGYESDRNDCALGVRCYEHGAGITTITSPTPMRVPPNNARNAVGVRSMIRSGAYGPRSVIVPLIDFVGSLREVTVTIVPNGTRNIAAFIAVASNILPFASMLPSRS